MPRRRSLWPWAALALLPLAGLTASSLSGARADNCIAKPNAPAPRGQHWYYHLDRATQRQCWYLREEGLPVRAHAAAQKQETRAETPESQDSDAQPVQAAAGPFDSDVATVEPVPWLDVTNLSIITFAAPPAYDKWLQPAWLRSGDGDDEAPSSTGGVPALAQAGSAEDRIAEGATTGSAAERDAPAPRSQAAAPQPLSAADAGMAMYVFALAMTLLGGVAVAGPLFHFLQQRARAAAGFRPPPWARVVALNAPTPRIRVPRLRTADSAARSVAPLPPAASTERLAQALRQVLERLKEDEAPGIAPAMERSARLPPSRFAVMLRASGV
jgi:hypothetical protein